MVFFDFFFENILINFKISEMDFYHSLSIRKIVVGALKGINKVYIYNIINSIKKFILLMLFKIYN